MPDSPTPERLGPDTPPGPSAGMVESGRIQVGRVRDVEILDTPAVRVHHPSDLVGVVVSAIATVLVLVLATYAQNTTTGVAEDVQGFASILRQILNVPVAVLEGAVTILVPVAVLMELAFRRLGRQLVESLVAAVGAILLCTAVGWAVATFGSTELVGGLSVRLAGESVLTIPGFMGLISGLLTATGPRARRRTVVWSWNLLWVAVGVVVVTAQVSLPGVGVAILLGRVAGLGVRYLSGVQSERAYGTGLVDGVRRAGFDPVRLVRVPDDLLESDSPDDAPATTAAAMQPATRALTRYSDHRVYELTTVEGEQLDVVVLDGDRQVLGVLSRLWRSLRLRGIDRRSVVSLRQATERAALLSYAARAAGVRTPKLLSVAEAEDSMLLVQEEVRGAVPLSSVPRAHITDALLREIWAQLQLAHDAGIAHRALTSDVILVQELLGQPVVWLVGWDQGDVASSELARRMDVTALVALLALRVGATRALASAGAVLPDDDIAAVGPLLQTIGLPRRTRDEMRTHKEVLAELRSALVERLPEADIEPERLVRFGARTLLTILITLGALVVVLTTINVRQITEALQQSDLRWSVVSFGLGLVTLVGASLALVAFAPVKIPVWRATLTQSAATFVALAAPAGIGPAALNLRLLTRRGVSASLAAATVALVQVSQFIVTVALLIVLSIASGTNEATKFTVTPTMLFAIGLVAALVAAAMLVPPVRKWISRKTLPMLRQTWPRLIEVVGQPRRLLLALGGNVLMTMGYVLAFQASLLAFDQHLSIVQVALIYLAGNSIGAIVPIPGGVGTIEATLIALLSSIGAVNPGIAASVTILFRVLTYWLRIPIGWLSMRFLQRQGEL
ncbi:TIGR00374 family protein [Cellulomonas sp. WB94]|uniref:lysylphosphatidylglycerol synthase domain-containing protein n=1 Tax=Cellulomonas sp. WB94 TaxID=2173174 RepID=UPI000D570F6B|nr:lysylphosphatidylglycerol synthase domain-containing protein [Cellulomonas sp. WB94]PVU83006.1 TIGR00374 family protein [Cellulomonas sp. WB94]